MSRWQKPAITAQTCAPEAPRSEQRSRSIPPGRGFNTSSRTPRYGLECQEAGRCRFAWSEGLGTGKEIRTPDLLWGTLASLIDVADLFDAETASLDDVGQPLRESGYGDLLDLFGLIGLVLDKVGAGNLAFDHSRTVREAHPEWFSASMVGPGVAKALSGILDA